MQIMGETSDRFIMSRESRLNDSFATNYRMKEIIDD
jgi:hypothetical protein